MAWVIGVPSMPGHRQVEAGELDRWLADRQPALENVKRQGWAEAVTSHVEEVTGRAPETYRAFIERNRGRIS